MFIERRLNKSNNSTVELWRCEWEHPGTSRGKKVYLQKIGDEQQLVPDSVDPLAETQAICWSYGRTLGNIAVYSPSLLGRFPEKAGADAQLPCDFMHAGKFRHGAERWWCRTHQTRWRTMADQESFDRLGEVSCANHTQAMNYVVSPFTVNLNEHAEVGVWCSMPAALSTEAVNKRAPKIHAHIHDGPERIVDETFGEVILNGKVLERSSLIRAMIDRSIT